MTPWSGELRAYFTNLGITAGTGGPIGQVVALLASGGASRLAYRELLDRHGLRREQWFHKDRLDLVLGLVSTYLETGEFNSDRQRDVSQLKEFLEIREGEFAEFRPAEVATLLQTQLDYILQDREIDSSEDLQLAELQRAFDLGYDQYLSFVRRVLERVWRDLSIGAAELESERGAVDEAIVRQIAVIEPLYRMAISQRRTLGALY
jgi:hypothetical protein